jgi:hypothetical protein
VPDAPLHETPAPDPMAHLDDLIKESYKSVYAVNLPMWTRNMRFWSHHLYDTRPLSIDDLVLPSYDGRNVICAGSGPSLRHLERAHAEQTTLIAAATNVGYLMSQGIYPDMIVVSDAQPILHAHLWSVREELKNIPIVLPTLADPIWALHPINNNYYFYKPFFSVSSGGMTENLFNLIVNDLFPQIGPWIIQAGCVTNTMLTVVMRIAERWPISRLIFIGKDFGHRPGGEHRIPISHGQEGKSTKRAWSPRSMMDTGKEFIESEGHMVGLNDVAYALSSILLIKDMPFEVVLASDESLLSPYVPVMSMTRALESTTLIFQSMKETYEHYEKAALDFAKRTEPIIKYFQSQQREIADKNWLQKAKDMGFHFTFAAPAQTDQGLERPASVPSDEAEATGFTH